MLNFKSSFNFLLRRGRLWLLLKCRGSYGRILILMQGWLQLTLCVLGYVAEDGPRLSLYVLCLYVCTHMHTYIHMGTDMHLCTHIHTRMYTYMCMYMYDHIYDQLHCFIHELWERWDSEAGIMELFWVRSHTNENSDLALYRLGHACSNLDPYKLLFTTFNIRGFFPTINIPHLSHILWLYSQVPNIMGFFPLLTPRIACCPQHSLTLLVGVTCWFPAA